MWEEQTFRIRELSKICLLLGHMSFTQNWYISFREVKKRYLSGYKIINESYLEVVASSPEVEKI